MDYTTCITYLCLGVVLGALVIVIADQICRANDKRIKEEEEKRKEREEWLNSDCFEERLTSKIEFYRNFLKREGLNYELCYGDKIGRITKHFSNTDYYLAYGFSYAESAMVSEKETYIILVELMSDEWIEILFAKKNSIRNKNCKWKNTCDYYRSR